MASSRGEGRTRPEPAPRPSSLGRRTPRVSVVQRPAPLSSQAAIEEMVLRREEELRSLFDSFEPDPRGFIAVEDIVDVLVDGLGLDADRPDIRESLAAMSGGAGPAGGEDRPGVGPGGAVLQRRDSEVPSEAASSGLDSKSVSYERFRAVMSDPRSVVRRALTGELAVPRFVEVCRELVRAYMAVRGVTAGRTVQYIPNLRDVDPSLFGFSVCTVDGQRFSYGNCSSARVSLQGCVTPFTYATVLRDIGIEATHRVVGQEPSTSAYNSTDLNRNNLPPNPFVNSGAIAVCSLIKPDLPLSDRFEHVVESCRRLAGGRYGDVGFSQSIYLSEKVHADINYSLAYNLKSSGVLTQSFDRVDEFVDLYLQLGCLEVSTSTLATMASTLAAGGRCPLTGERVFSASHTARCLSSLYSSGMFNASGQFAFSVGLPAKSGVSGLSFAVVPNVMGVAVYSPLLDSHGSSVRANEFFRVMAQRLQLSVFSLLASRRQLGLPRSVSTSPTLTSAIMSPVPAPGP